jgi:ADP-ribosyl-[dinitrogen reductase] hydrolase
MTSIDDRKKGCLLGLAWGDVLGCPVEGWRDREISSVYGTYPGLPDAYPFEVIAAMGPRKVKRLRPLGLHSDDTQQALARQEVQPKIEEILDNWENPGS